jgi:cytoskeleton protein RodZ
MFTEKMPGNNSQELRKTREALGISLEDLFKRTRVREIYLQAIENEEFDLLPVSVYAKNFIKIYARALGIDSEPIIKKYEVYLDSRKESPASEPENEPEKKHIFTNITMRRAYLSVAFVFVAVIVIFWLISKQYETSSDIINSNSSIANAVQENKEQNVNSLLNATNNIPAGQAEPDPAVAQNKKNIQLPVEMRTTFTSANSENNEVKPLRKQISLPVENTHIVSSGGETGLLVIKATEETWMRIKADQNQSFHVLLKPGEKFERRAESFNIDIGNAGGVEVQFKGKNIENLGKMGEVVHLRLP